jgi:hypothetical protein
MGVICLSACFAIETTERISFGEVWYWKYTLEVDRIKLRPALVFLNVKLSRTYRRITEQQTSAFFPSFLLQQVITQVQENKEGLNQVLIGQASRASRFRHDRHFVVRTQTRKWRRYCPY